MAIKSKGRGTAAAFGLLLLLAGLVGGGVLYWQSVNRAVRGRRRLCASADRVYDDASVHRDRHVLRVRGPRPRGRGAGRGLRTVGRPGSDVCLRADGARRPGRAEGRAESVVRHRRPRRNFGGAVRGDGVGRIRDRGRRGRSCRSWRRSAATRMTVSMTCASGRSSWRSSVSCWVRSCWCWRATARSMLPAS